MSVGGDYDKTTAVFFENRLRNVSELKEQNRRAVQTLINLLLDWQDENWLGKIELNISNGSVVNHIRPTPVLEIKQD